MKKNFIYFVALLLFLLSLVQADYLSAAPPQPPPNYGTYGCFSSGTSGGCHPSNVNCTAIGQVPNPNLCTGRPPGSCNGSSFPCMPITSLPPGSVVNTSSGPQLVNCPSGGKGIDTAIGCIPIEDDNGIARFFLRWGIGIGGGIAFILIVFAGYQIITSSGDPGKLKSGQELLTAAISGLMVLIFSAFILRFIGVDLLGIF